MNFKDLQAWLATSSTFLSTVERVKEQHVAAQFGLQSSPETFDWSYLLLCASILAPDSEGTSQDIALRLSHACLESPSSTESQRASAMAVLHSLHNQPSMELAKSRQFVLSNLEDQLPATVLWDWMRRRLVASPNGGTVLLNRLQQEVISAISAYEWMSISGPTSAGKSFALLSFIRDTLSGNQAGSLAYIVPTRALVAQVAEDIKRSLPESNLNIVTLPWMTVDLSLPTVFVLTQERLHVLLNRFTNLTLKSIVIDEAQKVGDTTRGILLQQAITKALARNDQLKVLFAMPLAENPETMLEDSPESIGSVSINRDERTVNQNLLWATQLPRKSKEWQLSIVDSELTQPIGDFSLPAIPSPTSKRLPFVAYALGEQLGGNLIYANTAADAEKMALQLYDIRGIEANSDSQSILDLIELVKQTVHPKYALVDTLRRGIGFHYGSMPQLIRQTLEDLFRKGDLKYMICTSTLIEGVNLPCKSIFVRGPSKGRGIPMKPSDFWNMGGRAGRWGKEFQGNVICVDPDDTSVWKNGAPRSRQRFKVVRSMDTIIRAPQELLQFLNRDSRQVDSYSESPLSYATSFLASCKIENGSIAATTWAKRFDQGLIADVDKSVESLLSRLGLPDHLILNNPGIDLFGMCRLKSYFVEGELSRNKNGSDWILADPASSDMVNRYTAALFRINASFGDLFGNEKRCTMLAFLMRDWMQGFQLARIIQSRLNRYPDLKTANVIRDCMKDVEEYARFRGPKYLKAYNEVLKVHLVETGQDQLLEEISDYEFQLELGVSHQTQLSLMAIGLSRSTAISVSELIAKDNLDDKECFEWLRENNWMTGSIPVIAQHEIARLLSLPHHV